MSKTSSTVKVIKALATAAFLSIGSLLLSGSVFCFLGGPDGKIGSSESIIWGAGYFIPGIIFFLIGFNLAKKL